MVVGGAPSAVVADTVELGDEPADAVFGGMLVDTTGGDIGTLVVLKYAPWA